MPDVSISHSSGDKLRSNWTKIRHMAHAESIFTVKSRKGFQTRRALIEAAYDLVANNGIEHLTIAAICDSVGRTRSSAYNHFPDIHALLDGVLAHALDRIAELSGARRRSRRLTRGVTETRLRFTLQLAAKHPELATVVSELYRHHEPAVESIERRLLSDIQVDIADGNLTLNKRQGPYFARIAVASVMATLRTRIATPGKRHNDSTVLRLLLDSVLPRSD